MEIKQLLYFTEICRYKSFSKAAERLYISQQGISMAIFRLEEELTCKLFSRAGKDLKLTEHGEFLLEHATEIVRQFQICEEYFDRENNAKHLRKTILISSSLGVMPEFAGELVFQFRQKYPEVRLEIQEGTDWECEEAIWNETAEIGFSMAPIDHKRFDSTELLRRRYSLIVHKSHQLAGLQSVPVEILRTTPIMMMDKRSKTNQNVTSCCQQMGFEPDVQFTAGEVLAIHRFVNANRGVGISVESVAEDMPQPNVCSIPFEDPRMVWSVHLIKKRGTVLSPITKVFERFVIEKMVGGLTSNDELSAGVT